MIRKVSMVKNKNIKSVRDKSKQEERRELTKNILKGLALGGLIVTSFALPNLPQVFSFLGVETSRERYAVKRAINSLARKKLIKIIDKGGEQVVEITEAGQKKTLKYKFEEMFIERPPKWDGMWRVVMFDIPEKHKQGRDALNIKLREMEFYPLQKSVFVFPFKCRDELDFICELFGIRDFVYYFAAKSIDNEERMKRYYNL